MKDARAANRAYRMHDPRLAAVRNGPPAPKRKCPRHNSGAPFENHTNDAENSDPLDVAQRAIRAALRRAGQLEHRAGLLAEVGQRDAALRLALLAGGLREVVL